MKRKFFSLVLILVIGGFAFFLSQKVKVLAAECQSQFGPCSTEVKSLVEGEIGKNIFSVKSNLAKTLSESSRVESYNIRFNLPDSLDVYVVEKKAEVALKFAEDKYFLFDKSANVVSETQSTVLPTITVRELPADNDINYAAKLFLELFKYYDVNSATLDKFGLAANIRDFEVIFPLEGDVDVLLGSMEVMLLQLNRARENPTMNEAGNLSVIDLRYKNPVIR